ncbi:uncharacterized protein MONOS_13125 [Monocercomonoides exilis]|uniref:uncharacterized protein n=1 Tax=Monocercomonoides exilis TaxID=2049356 RepID=UPI0035599514|nr:hypothetical protein MONOS_13125 [Monocercomonoides exilis]|eukprot:MONOS_13125.1-p1 / transcript=MONOS_13125.1 / gene=MONOS_13125 / organism=Monocercomonoides_exilis_PA203 / gene_product=unspecified product / transcript_product=unspecified product / location=Mono_scaffold00781:1972-2502(-) / protein_length=135 / sequence_SO=supercontig / SO=protein_coding / is_pseudo=false
MSDDALLNLYFSEQTPVAKFSVDDGNVLILSLASVQLQTKTGELTSWPLTKISSWGYSSHEFRILIIEPSSSQPKPVSFQTKEGVLILEFMKHIVDIILERSKKPRAFFTDSSDGIGMKTSENPLKTDAIFFDF